MKVGHLYLDDNGKLVVKFSVVKEPIVIYK